MAAWQDAAAAIAAAFADEEKLIYESGTFGRLPDVAGIRIEEPAQADGYGGKTLRTIAYEVRYVDLPGRPDKRDSFVHLGKIWKVEDVTAQDDVGAWRMMVSFAGAAA